MANVPHRLQKLVLALFALCATTALAQNGPWNNPLMMAWSADGRFFNASAIFQDSSGVPSAIRWKGDTLICALQWFRQPIGSPSWDRVAVKFSYDAGLHWTAPTPIVIAGLPSDYQRPFDPTLTAIAGDSIRVYFSSSRGRPQGLDSTVNTYSAVSADGIHYTFEPTPRVDHPTRRVIDPAMISFNGTWHYSGPIGAPQEGAYHYTSTNGLLFFRKAIILQTTATTGPAISWLTATRRCGFTAAGRKSGIMSHPMALHGADTSTPMCRVAIRRS